MTDEPIPTGDRRDDFCCICDPDDLFEPPNPTPRAVEGCPAHRARRAAQLFAERLGPLED